MSPLRRQNPREEPGALAAHAAQRDQQLSAIELTLIEAFCGSAILLNALPYRGRELAPLSRVALEQPSDQRLVRRLRSLIEADERRPRPRPITLPRLPSLERS